MAILIIEDKACSKFGGAEKSMFKYIEHLNEMNEEVILVYDRDGSWLEEENIVKFKNVLRLDLSPLKSQGLNYLRTLKTLRSFCKHHNIEKIFTHTVHCFPLLRLIKLTTKIEIVVYFKWVVNHENLGLMNNWGLKAIDKSFGNSQYVVDYWSRKKMNCTVELLPNGISVPDNLKSNTSFDSLKVMLFVGRIYEGKGLLELIEILPSLPNFKLIICGYFDCNEEHENLDYHKKIHNKVNELGVEEKIEFKGFVKSPIDFMTSETLVVIPSIWPESSSRVLYEAMMKKTSVIASNLGGMGDVLGEMSEYCLVSPTKDELLFKINDFENMETTKRERISSYLFDRFNNNYNINMTQKRLDNTLL